MTARPSISAEIRNALAAFDEAKTNVARGAAYEDVARQFLNCIRELPLLTLTF